MVWIRRASRSSGRTTAAPPRPEVNRLTIGRMAAVMPRSTGTANSPQALMVPEADTAPARAGPPSPEADAAFRPGRGVFLPLPPAFVAMLDSLLATAHSG